MADFEGFMRGMAMFGSGLQGIAQPYQDRRTAVEQAKAQQELWEQQQKARFEYAKQLAEFKQGLKGGRSGGGGGGGGSGGFASLGPMFNGASPAMQTDTTDNTIPQPDTYSGFFVDPNATMSTVPGGTGAFVDPLKQSKLIKAMAPGQVFDPLMTARIAGSLNKDYTTADPTIPLPKQVNISGTPIITKPSTGAETKLSAAQSNALFKSIKSQWNQALKTGDQQKLDALIQYTKTGKMPVGSKPAQAGTKPAANNSNTFSLDQIEKALKR